MLEIIVLAAGKGSRMRSNLPKVLHPVAGKPLLQHVTDTAQKLPVSKLVTVIGHGAEQVETVMSTLDYRLSYAYQNDQLGTGHAVAQALPALSNEATALILYGDVPLVRAETLQQLIALVGDTTMGLLTANLSDASGYGRIVRSVSGTIEAIVEQKDATPAQLEIKEVNTGMMAVSVKKLRQWLPKLENNNAQSEYYLTDIIALAVAEGMQVHSTQPEFDYEILGVNNRTQQAQIERLYQQAIAEQLMDAGLTLIDPQRFDCRGQLEHGQDCSVDINCIFEGKNRLGNNVKIGPNCQLIDADIGDNVVIAANSIIESSRVGEKSVIGPFARLRPGTTLHASAKIGNFVETKKATVGEGSKINHLSYVGDATLGKHVNIGAGTITCNYDGANKHQTVIQDNAFIGSNSALVAPVTVGDTATVGAGATITASVPDKALAVARAKQRHLADWPRPTKNT